MKRLFGVCLLVCLSPAAPATGAPPARVQSCATRSIGLDTTQANTYLLFYTGRSYGQTFTTQDTLIESITIWRAAVLPVDNTPLRMFITEVDSTGRPDVFHIVNSGAIIIIPPGDSVHATAGTWAYLPPLALPHRGMFCFAVHDNLYCSDAEPLLGSTLDPYPGGCGWRFEAANPCNYLGPPFYDVCGTDDLIFTIDFCDTSTPVRQKTWGEVKTLYR
jgi:hypothetical protein